jgi:hypothetical protein
MARVGLVVTDSRVLMTSRGGSPPRPEVAHVEARLTDCGAFAIIDVRGVRCVGAL